MIWLIGLAALETALEALLCAGYFVTARFHRAFCLLLAVVLAGVSVALSVVAWREWVWLMPLSGYRLVNILRVYRLRMPLPQLRVVVQRAFWWLVAAQIATVLVAWVVASNQLALKLLDVLVAAQLLCAVVLLRSATHTWQHAGMPTNRTTLTDSELPSLSVLVPARNETDDLDRCLQALVASDYPKLEILVLDDCSANRHTPEIIRSFAHAGVRFLQGTVPDEKHWLAKNFAYAQLAHEASGELLLFCGVDAVVEPQSLRQLVTALEHRGKDMVSVMPLRAATPGRRGSLLQTVRYYWEISLPRRIFKRPPVLSTCWLVRAATLERFGGFESVSRSVSPEAQFARRAVVNDAYSFLRSDSALGVYSNKTAAEQYASSVRVRYPQLHRRLELVALLSFFELVFLLGPLIGLVLANNLAHTVAYMAMWGVALLCLFVTYALVAVGARLASPLYGWLLMPVAFAVDLAMLHISLWKYEFSTVDWKGRNVCIPVMRFEAHGRDPK